MDPVGGRGRAVGDRRQSGLGAGRTLTLNMESTYDWESSQWSIPVSLLYTKVTNFGGQLVSIGDGARASATL